MAELFRMSAAGIAAAIRDGEASAAEVTDAHLARIEEVDGRVRAFLHVADSHAHAAARRAKVFLVHVQWRSADAVRRECGCGAGRSIGNNHCKIRASAGLKTRLRRPKAKASGNQ